MKKILLGIFAFFVGNSSLSALDFQPNPNLNPSINPPPIVRFIYVGGYDTTDANTLKVVDKSVYLLDYYDGLYVFNVIDPQNPKIIKHMKAYCQWSAGIDMKYNPIIRKYHIYLARLGGGITLLSYNPNVIGGGYSFLAKYNTAGHARAITGFYGVATDTLYVADGEDGLLKLKYNANGFAVLKHIKPGISRNFYDVVYKRLYLFSR